MNNRFIAGFIIALLVLLAADLPLLHARVEPLSPEQQAQYLHQLPDAISSASSPELKAYLRQLQNTYHAAKDDAAKAELTYDIANGVRVAADMKDSKLPGVPGADFAWYVVPAVSPVMRLPNVFPLDGTPTGTLGIVAAQDEYEPASFVVFPFEDMSKVILTVSDLKNADGKVLPSSQLDLKVVKVWYQNGNGWFSYFSDVGLKLVPELLLHDENLIRVDTVKKANYARVDGPNGPHEVWISAPQKLHIKFHAMAVPFADADHLQPVALKAGAFQQFWLTAHIKADTAPGLYQGTIRVTAAGQQPTVIPVALRVLPFALPMPKTNFDIHKDFLVTLMGAWPRVGPGHPAFMPILKDLRAHNILELGPNATPDMPSAEAKNLVDAMKEAGFNTDIIIGGNVPWVGAHGGKPLTFDELMTVKRSAEAWHAFYQQYFGDVRAAVGIGDEPGTGWVLKTRPIWRIINQSGLMTSLAGHTNIFAKAAYTMDIHPAAGSPADAEIAEHWRKANHSHGYIGFYANQHNGSENPTFVRRQHGMLSYLSDFSMVDNYEFAYGPWNDRANELYKPMVLAYPTSKGLVDTIEWEGFREGIDDIRYATKLRELAEKAIASGDLDQIYAGRQVRLWFATLDGSTADLNAVRAEMVHKILSLMQLERHQSRISHK